MCVCVCVCVREREIERERECVCECVYASDLKDRAVSSQFDALGEIPIGGAPPPKKNYIYIYFFIYIFFSDTSFLSHSNWLS